MAGNTIDGSITVAFAPSVVASIQDRTLVRIFRDTLLPRFLFRLEAVSELWPVNLGTNQTFTRVGSIPPVTRPLAAGQDPQSLSYGIEQWELTAAQWASAIDTHMPTSYVSLASQYLRNVHQLGIHAGQSINRVVRDVAYNSYTAGNTVTDQAANNGDTTIHVVNLNGFAKKLFNGRPTDISSSNPLPISIPAISYTGNVTAVSPDTTGDLIHGGTLTLSPALTANLPSRSAVLAVNRSVLQYSGGGNSVDDITPSDQFQLRDVRAAIAQLRFNNVEPHEDGLYHFHIDPFSENQLFGDNEMQRLNQSLPDYVHYRRFAAGILLGAVFYRNNETPFVSTVNEDPSQGHTTGFETVNAAGVRIHRPIVTGIGWIEEKYLDEAKFMSEAGVTGKIGEFSVTNQGVQVMTERIRLVLRAPLDKLQQLTSSSWSISGGWVCPTDELAPNGSATFRRAVACVHGE